MIDYKVKQKQVLIIGPDINISHGGIASVLKSYSKTFLWEKYNISILDPYSEKGNLCKLFNFFFGLLTFPYLSRLTSIVHLHVGGHISLTRKCFFLLLSKIFHKKIILHIHNIRTILFLKDGPKLVIKILNWVIGFSDVIIVLSSSMKKELEKIQNNKIIKVLNNPCSVNPIRNNINKKSDCNIFFAGLICKEKGCYDLLYSFQRILIKKPNLKLVMAGNGEIDKIKKIISDIGIEKSVRLTGWIDDKGMEKEYNNATIFCLPSYQEGMPIVLIEAMAYRLPVITTPVGVINDFIKSGVNGMITPVGNIQMLSKNILKLLEDKKLRMVISNNGYKLAVQKFSREKIVKNLDYIYKQI
jgi:glycosyltransferase involved in cell wall biosynthesis